MIFLVLAVQKPLPLTSIWFVTIQSPIPISALKAKKFMFGYVTVKLSLQFRLLLM